MKALILVGLVLSLSPISFAENKSPIECNGTILAIIRNSLDKYLGQNDEISKNETIDLYLEQSNEEIEFDANKMCNLVLRSDIQELLSECSAPTAYINPKLILLDCKYSVPSNHKRTAGPARNLIEAKSDLEKCAVETSRAWNNSAYIGYDLNEALVNLCSGPIALIESFDPSLEVINNEIMNEAIDYGSLTYTRAISATQIVQRFGNSRYTNETLVRKVMSAYKKSIN